MKKYVLLIVAMVVSAHLIAQRGEPSMGDRQIERMKTELSLSEDQFTRLKAVNEIFRKDQGALRADTSLTKEEVMARRKIMIDKRNNAIKGILTEQQYSKWIAMKNSHGRRAEFARNRENRMLELKKEVGLSDEQVEKIKAINAEMEKEFGALRSDSTMSRADRPKEAKAIVSRRNEKIKKLLTRDQYEKFLTYENERVQARRKGHAMRKRQRRN
jgi:hypothetical protein